MVQQTVAQSPVVGTRAYGESFSLSNLVVSKNTTLALSNAGLSNSVLRIFKDLKMLTDKQLNNIRVADGKK